MKTRKTITTFLLGIVMCLAVGFGVGFSSTGAPATTAEAATTYTTKDIAMMGRVAGWYGNGNFEIRLTLGECDWTEEASKVYAGTGDLPGTLKSMDFFNHIKLGEKTLAEWGCTTCYSNDYWLNQSEPDYTITIPLAMGKDNMSNASAAGIGSNTPLTILEGALIPGDAYLQGDTTATVYRAGCDFVTYNADVNYGIMAVGKTEVESLKYVTGWDANYNNAYLGVSLKGDDYVGNGTQTERAKDYNSSVYMTNHFSNKLLADGVGGKAEQYGLFNLGSKGQGYFSFVFRAMEEETEEIFIPAGTMFPSYAMVNLPTANKNNHVYMMYETQTDVTFYKQADGTWQKPLVEKETDVSSVKVQVGSTATDTFTVFSLATHDYPITLDNYGGEAIRTKDFLAQTNFFSHVLINDVAIGSTGEAYLNVWGNKGALGIRTSAGTDATKIAILEGCEFPTYAALSRGEREVYVTTHEMTFVKDENGNWVEYIPEGDFDTEVTQVQYGRSTNVLNINLSVNDYPAPNGNDATTYNIGVDMGKVLALNLFDNIIVDGYTLRTRYNNANGANTQAWVNRFVGHNFAIRVPTSDGVDINPSKIVIRAGTQFPSMSYFNRGAELFYVTTEEVTYVRVSNDKEVSWAKQATITFVADGETVATLPYTVEQGIQGELPAVPDKAGHKGAWESYTLNGDNLVVEAVYTAHDFTEIETNVSKMEFAEGFVILYLTNNDYPTNQGTIDVKDLMSNLHFYDYLEVDGKKMADGLREIDGAFFSVWNRFGSFATYLPNHYTPTTSIVLKKGCQIPSNANRLDNANKTCYVLTEDVTFLKEGDAWVRQSNGEEEGTISSKPNYENDYVLSDLYNTGHPSSAELEKGYLLVDKTTQGNVYGYNVSQSFSITFDFTLNLGDNDVSALGNYTTFNISMSTRGYNWSKGFGWNFYLYRPGNVQKCVEFTYAGTGYGTTESLGIFEKGVTYRVTLGYKLIDEATGTVETYVNINGEEATKTIELGADYASFALTTDSICFSSNAAITNGVRISDPGMTEGDERYTLTLVDGANTILTEKAWKYTLPALNAYEYGKQDSVFVGWTTNLSTLDTLYAAGYTMELTGDTTLYPVWLHFAMRDGAAVRTIGESGLRFLVDVDGAGYQLATNKGYIVDAGTLVVPTSYLDSVPFVHESFSAGYYMDIPTDTWGSNTGSVWTYAAALINISPAQYTRSMSARGYLKISYTDGTESYVYTAYSKDLNARSIYNVATAAYNNNQRPSMVLSYVNSIADITLNGALEASKNVNSVGDYTLSATTEGATVTLTFNKAVKGLLINGTRIVAGYTAEVTIGGQVYEVIDYKLASNGLTATFKVEVGEMESYYATLANYYKNSNDYSELYKNEILSILDAWAENYANAEVNAAYASQLAAVKTETEALKNVGSVQLATPVVAYGAGYTVTWNAIPNADYYLVTDDNDYRDGVYVLATEELTYKTEVVGKHNVTVTAYSFYEQYAASQESASFAAVEVKPVFTYKAMSDGLYKFDKNAMNTMGIGANLNTNNDGTSYYYDSGEKLYFAYYNKDTGWSKDQGAATDWTSPAEFPAHAARLKAMGNNVILLSENTTASFKANDVWETSRTKYVMDTAWSLGMKVIVCDDVLYAASATVSSKSAAASTIASLNGFTKYVNHPAFYGFSLEDEPEPDTILSDEIKHVGYMVQALKEACANLGYSKANGNEPFFLSCLYQKAAGFDLTSYDDYLEDWLDGTGLDYLYVDLYTGHAMGDNTNRYVNTYDVIYGNGTNGIIGTDVQFHQAITAHTQSKDKAGVLLEQDMYMSMLYAAAHNVAGYSWFCYFPISSETAGSMVGFDGNGYGNGIGNSAMTGYSYYNAAKIAGSQFELIQGLLNGYKLKTRSHTDSGKLLTTTLSNGANTITMYVNADVQGMSTNKTVTASGSACYLIGYGVGTESAPYQLVSGSITLQPGQAVICVG